MRLTSRRFFLKKPHFPTQFNLHRYLLEQGWSATRLKALAGFSDDHLAFDEAAAGCLEYKHLLARLVQDYCPEIMPETYAIDDHNWPQVLNQLERQPVVWILKPALLNNGQHIRIFQSIDALERHFLSPQRLGGPHVLQRYISHPHLLRDKRKYSIRMFVILTNYDGAYVYEEGYFNVALQPYPANHFSDLRGHLTNEHLHGQEGNVLQIPTRQFEHFELQFHNIKHMLGLLISALEQEFPAVFRDSGQRKIAIFGFDFLIDNTGRLWLLEANHGPCFPVEADHPLQQHLYAGFWQALIRSFIEPIADKTLPGQIQYPRFEKIADASAS